MRKMMTIMLVAAAIGLVFSKARHSEKRVLAQLSKKAEQSIKQAYQDTELRDQSSESSAVLSANEQGGTMNNTDKKTLLDMEDDWLNHIDKLPPNERRYADAILHFKASLADISEEDINQERQALNNLWTQAMAYPITQPQSSPYIDKNGNKWMQRVYEGNIVRYDFWPQG